MLYTQLTKQALSLAYAAHKDQVDKAGLPYIFHPFHLAEQMADETSTVVALLHDVIEDTDLSIESLRQAGFPDRVLHPLKLLTHTPGVPYMDYIREIAKDPVARAVKLADLRHNSDLTRLDVVTDRDVSRVEKYTRAIKILVDAEEK